MKKTGRPPKVFSEKELSALRAYIAGEVSSAAAAKLAGTNKSTFKYWKKLFEKRFPNECGKHSGAAPVSSKTGRPPKEFSEKELAAIRQYMETDVTGDEVAKRLGIQPSTFRYMVKKYRMMLSKTIADSTT